MPDMPSGILAKDILKIKEIIAIFLKTDKDSINEATVIDRSVIKGSIMIHRMYAAISKELNFEIKGYDKIKTFSELLEKFSLVSKDAVLEKISTEGLESFNPRKDKNPAIVNNINLSIGIDIEEVGKLPKAVDFKTDIFYKQNFSPQEISYCLMQAVPLQSFAGKFAAKEAIVKADNYYKNIPFSQIEVGNDANGAPYFKDFAVSVSHIDKLAIAVVVKLPG